MSAAPPRSAAPIIEARDVTKILAGEERPVTLVADISMKADAGEFVAVTGTSGTGKSSLLYLLSLLYTPTDGEILLQAGVIDDFQQPNGLCLSNDERKLFVNDSWGPHIRVFDVAADGALSGGAIWAEVTGVGDGVPDGMKCDLESRIWCNGPGGVHIFAPDGAWIGRVAMPEKVTNFCWGGATGRTLFVTGVSTLWRVETATGAKPMIHGA